MKTPRINALKRCIDVTDEEYKSMEVSAALENRGDTNVIVSCFLDECMFSAGMLRGYGGGNMVELKEQLILRNNSAEIITVHANFMMGNRPKMEKLKQNNLWTATLGSLEDSDDYFDFFNIPASKRPLKKNDDTHIGVVTSKDGSYVRKYYDGECVQYDDNNDSYVRDGTLIKMVKQAETFVVQQGKKRSIPDLATFMALGFDFSDVKTLAKEEFNVIPTGIPCPSVSVASSLPGTENSTDNATKPPSCSK